MAFAIKAVPVIGIIVGSKSDEKVMQPAADLLQEFDISFEGIIVCSAHRNPIRAAEYASRASARGLRIIIAGAGLAAALPGVLAAHTTLPVIGVPINADNSLMAGMDAVSGILQMPPGIPVATVGINNARNAALLATQMLAMDNADARAAIIRYRDKWNQPS